MLDFPNAPTVGQIFAAPNSVNYEWSGVLWRAVGGAVAPTPGGDFMAQRSTALALTGSLAVLTLNNVVTGNSGNWYVPASGRFTPPSGRHFIRGSMSAFNAGGTAGSVDFQLRKNGVTILDRASVTTPAGSADNPIVAASVDANGTDYFELFASSSASTGDITNLTFQAFPLTGLKGPPGDPGAPAFRLLQRQVLVAAGPSLDLTGIPADINDLEIRFDVTPTTNSQDLVVRFYDGAGALISAGYGFTSSVSQNSVAAGTAPVIMNNTIAAYTAGIIVNYSAASARVNNGSGVRGWGKINNIRAATRYKSIDWQLNYVNDALTSLYSMSGSGWNGTAVRALTGVQLFFGSSTLAAGSEMSVWGSP